MLKTEQEKLYTRIEVTYNETFIRSTVAHIKKKTVSKATRRKN